MNTWNRFDLPNLLKQARSAPALLQNQRRPLHWWRQHRAQQKDPPGQRLVMCSGSCTLARLRAQKRAPQLAASGESAAPHLACMQMWCMWQLDCAFDKNKAAMLLLADERLRLCQIGFAAACTVAWPIHALQLSAPRADAAGRSYTWSHRYKMRMFQNVKSSRAWAAMQHRPHKACKSQHVPLHHCCQHALHALWCVRAAVRGAASWRQGDDVGCAVAHQLGGPAAVHEAREQIAPRIQALHGQSVSEHTLWPGPLQWSVMRLLAQAMHVPHMQTASHLSSRTQH